MKLLVDELPGGCYNCIFLGSLVGDFDISKTNVDEILGCRLLDERVSLDIIESVIDGENILKNCPLKKFNCSLRTIYR